MNKHKKNISIAIPTYNSSAYLNLLIKQLGKSSVVNEIVISDDGSLSSEIKNIKVIISKNKNYFPKINFKILENTKKVVHLLTNTYVLKTAITTCLSN